MAKSSGTTGTVGSRTASAGRTSRSTFASGGTYDTGGTIAGYSAVGAHFNAMRESLNQYAEQNGWRRVGSQTMIKTVSETDNIRTVGISIGESIDEGKASLYYEVRVDEYKPPFYESRDFNAYQNGLKNLNGRKFNTLKEANETLNRWIKRLNKMKIE